MPVGKQYFAAMEGSKSLNVTWMSHLRRIRHPIQRTKSGILRYTYFRTLEHAYQILCCRPSTVANHLSPITHNHLTIWCNSPQFLGGFLWTFANT